MHFELATIHRAEAAVSFRKYEQLASDQRNQNRKIHDRKSGSRHEDLRLSSAGLGGS